MRTYQIPAKYAPELQEAIEAVVRRVRGHQLVTRDDPAYPAREGFIADAMIDNSRTGDLIVVVGEAVTYAAQVFPLERHRIAS